MSVKWSRDELVLTGDRAALDGFASNIRNLGNRRVGGKHIHLEYFRATSTSMQIPCRSSFR